MDINFTDTSPQHLPQLLTPERFFHALMSRLSRHSLISPSPARIITSLWQTHHRPTSNFLITFRSCCLMDYFCRAIEEELKTTTFEITPVMSTYLLAFTVSEFRGNGKISQDVLFSVYSSQKALSSMQFALDSGVKALRALEDYIGHKYTLSKMDFIAIDDFLMGAMVRWRTFCVRRKKIFVITWKLFSGKLGTYYIQVSVISLRRVLCVVWVVWVDWENNRG